MADGRKNSHWIYAAGLGVLAAGFVAGFLLLRGRGAESPGAEGPGGEGKVEGPGGTGTGVPVEAAVPARENGVVYEDNFTGEPGPEWNYRNTLRTKKGDRPYLGDFFPGTKPTLSLRALPAHKLVRVTFDLFLFKSWDGSNSTYGPGLLDARVGGDDGRTLLHATFCNTGFFPLNNEQSFPDNYPARPYEAWTLATENQSLGVMIDWGGPTQTFDSSGVYHMVFTFPHAGAGIDLEFESTLPDNPNKPFGLTNFKVETVAELATFSPKEMDALWADLGSGSARTFYEAHWKLVSAGDAATAYIAGHYGELVIPAHPQITVPGGTAKAYPTEKAVIHRERARWVLEAIHTPAALALKKAIPTVIGG